MVQRTPGGIRRVATIAVAGWNSLVMSLLAEAVGGGGWAAIVGARDFSPLPALEHGIDLARLEAREFANTCASLRRNLHEDVSSGESGRGVWSASTR